MSLKDLITHSRSYRRFYQEFRIERELLIELVNLGRLSPSLRNLQPLKYYLVNEEQECEKVFPHLEWAGYLPDWPGPVEGERPAAYILICIDQEICVNRTDDVGIAAQSILLGATEMGLGGCIIASLDRKELKKIFILPCHLELFYVIALGKPKERIVVEEINPGDSIKYWRDEHNIHHVPKRGLGEIIL
jgi:nitroreductase